MSTDDAREVRMVKSQDLRLSHGTGVRVVPGRDAGLDRYRGASGQVVSDDGLVVEVAIPGAGRISFWRREVDLIAEAGSGKWAAPPGEEDLPGRSLREERLAAHLTQAVLAKALGVSVPRVSGIERQSWVSRPVALRYRAAIRAAEKQRR
ncbi:MAG: helix-turn-helix domain-containing protein [Candidatus Dormibacteraeota bacterium]|nr:helix-turn-helix domain-containing protein [Candidatus Dormibacteraeota bacterium]